MYDTRLLFSLSKNSKQTYSDTFQPTWSQRKQLTIREYQLKKNLKRAGVCSVEARKNDRSKNTSDLHIHNYLIITFSAYFSY